MFTNESTENLLDNFEETLTEVIELEKTNLAFEAVEHKEEIMPPIPAKRNLNESKEKHVNPVPAARRLQSLDKSEKNDENEIIQLSSMSSSSVSENRKNFSQNTVVIVSDKKVKTASHKILVVEEAEAVQNEETFFVVKHGKWGHEEKVQSEAEESIDTTSSHESPKPAVRLEKQQQGPHFEIVSERPEKISVKHQNSESISSLSHMSVESSSESSSSSEESLKTKKKLKEKLKAKQKKKSKKKKFSSEDQITTTESSFKDSKEKTLSGQAIGKV